jgi:tetratricopeptide (TPR) repeat protein
MVRAASQLGQAGREDEAIVQCDEVVQRFGALPNRALQRAVAEALFYKAIALRNRSRSEDAIAVLDDLLLRFEAVEDESLREWRALALFNKGVVLRDSARSDEALAALEEVDRRYNEDASPLIRERVARALGIRAQLLWSLARFAQAIPIRADLIRRFGADSDEVMTREVAAARELQERLLASGPVPVPEEALAAMFSLADSGIGHLLTNASGGIGGIISIIDPGPGRALSEEETLELKERCAAELERRRQFVEELQARAEVILSAYMRDGAPFVLFLRSFDIEAYYARSSQGNIVIRQNPGPAPIESRLARALEGRLPLVGILNPSVVRADFVQPIPKMSVADAQWRGIVRILVSAADMVVMALSRVTPGVATELESILELGRKGTTVVVLSDPKDSIDVNELFGWIPGGTGTKAEPERAFDEKGTLRAFPHVIEEAEIPFDDLDASPIFGPLLARIGSFKRGVFPEPSH